MILRVWALYNRSRSILGTLLTFYAIEVIAFFVTYLVIDIRSPHDPIGELKSLDIMHNTKQNITFSWLYSRYHSSAWFFFLCNRKYCSSSLGSNFRRYANRSRDIDVSSHHHSILEGVTSNVQSNKAIPTQCLYDTSCERKHYLLHCVRSCLLPRRTTQLIPMSSILGFALFNILGNARVIPTDGGWFILTMELQQVPPFTLVPRFILNLRELYAHDARRGNDIDTAFGLALGPWHASAVLADAGRDEDDDQTEGMVKENHSMSSLNA